jgi:DNA-binding NarL/FixJ family response regulator
MKILVIDDHALVREGLCQVLQGLGDDMEVVQAGTCTQGFLLAQTHPDLDLVVLDYHLPDMSGLRGLVQFGQQHPELPVLILSGSADLETMRTLMRAGAAGFVNKSTHSDALLSAVRSVLAGDIHFPAELNTNAEPLTNTEPQYPASVLTQRQEQVLNELLAGRSNREIGESVGMAEETVKTHVAAILRHFRVQNRTQAVVAATRSGYKPFTNA